MEERLEAACLSFPTWDFGSSHKEIRMKFWSKQIPCSVVNTSQKKVNFPQYSPDAVLCAAIAGCRMGQHVSKRGSPLLAVQLPITGFKWKSLLRMKLWRIQPGWWGLLWRIALGSSLCLGDGFVVRFFLITPWKRYFCSNQLVFSKTKKWKVLLC